MSEPGKSRGGGNLKYVLAGLLLLAGAVGVFSLLKSSAPGPLHTAHTADVREPAPATAPELHNAERVNPLAQPDLILDEPSEPQGTAPDAAVVTTAKPKPAEARAEADCHGDVPVSAVRAVIQDNSAQVRACYERRLRANNMLQGDLKLRIKIASTGQSSTTSITGTLKDNEVVSCVRSLAQHWSFPAPTGGACAFVEVPFKFSPKQ